MRSRSSVLKFLIYTLLVLLSAVFLNANCVGDLLLF